MSTLTDVESPTGHDVDPGPPAPVLEARGLTKVYGRGDGSLRAVDHVDLVVHGGEVVGLLGPNGAGKTTTIKMVAGLVTPTAGGVTIGRVDLRRHRGAAVRQLGAVLEGGRNVYWALSAWQNLVYFGRLRGLRRRDFEARAEWLLRELGLWERRYQAVGGYSRGMQQKVAIAAALVSDPALLLLDEPTIGLDVSAARTVKDWIRRLAAEEGTAVVLTTHQLALAEELSHRVAVISHGRIIDDRPVADLLGRFREDRFEIEVAAPPGAVPPSMLYDVGDGAPGRDGPDGADGSAGPDRADGSAGQATLLVSADRLHDVLDLLVRDRVPLVSVTPVQPDLETVFVRLVEEDRQ